jgi:heme-degrading monooxygenase HmoA
MSSKEKSHGYAVIFSSVRNSGEDDGYERMAQAMSELASRQPGFLGYESVRDLSGKGITVSYWSTLEAIQQWRENSEHRVAQERGKSEWYKSFQVRIAKIERQYDFNGTSGP